MSALARRAGVGLRTVQRTLSGESQDANLGTFLKLAAVLGVTFEPKEDRAMLRHAAAAKAKQLAAMVQGTSALEGQAVGGNVIRTIEEQLAATLLAGSRARLWHE
jgi:transcriptional regulator with XRE-family HTH domain